MSLSNRRRATSIRRTALRSAFVVCLALLTRPVASAAQGAPAGNPSGGENRRFSTLDQINTGNVGRLTLAFTFRTDQPGGHSGAPAVLGDTLFVQTPFPHRILALDLRQRSAPVKWSFSPPADGRASGLACCDATAAGPSPSGDRLYVNTLDGHTIALDAASGRVMWDFVTADTVRAETLATAPTVVGDRVFVGNAGDDFGARGWIAALDAATGRTLWKRFNIGPDQDVGIGTAFRPPYPSDQGRDLGVETWPPQAWQQGGGGLASDMVYDAGPALLIYGTGHPAPWNPDPRPGDNKWTSGLFARDPATGDARWFVSVNPHDLYALGAGGSLLLADLPWHGSNRHLLIHPDANGQVYVLDPATGRILSAIPFTPVNATGGVDLATGALHRSNAGAITPNSVTRGICPAWPGATGTDGTSLGGSAFSPQTRLLYIPANRLCMDMEARDTSFMAGTPFIGANLRMTAAPGTSRGELIAWDVEAGKPAWTADEAFPVEGSVLATAGGLVFYGTLDDTFRASDARTGRLLWQFRTSSGIIGQPITFQLSDGHQYVAVMAGTGGAAGRVAENGIDLRDATAAHGYTNALHDLKQPADFSGTLYVFALPG
jgi:PQQ-dependent dehydrogenase (methanol/ethanol family)